MAKKPLRVVIDTNIIISALVFGGKPEEVYNLVLEKQILAFTSSILLAELTEVLTKKFNFEVVRIQQLEKIIKKYFKTVFPNLTLNILKDTDDNRVLEAAVEGKCQYIITGDKELLKLRVFKNIQIVSAEEFLAIFEKN